MFFVFSNTKISVSCTLLIHWHSRGSKYQLVPREAKEKMSAQYCSLYTLMQISVFLMENICSEGINKDPSPSIRGGRISNSRKLGKGSEENWVQKMTWYISALVQGECDGARKRAWILTPSLAKACWLEKGSTGCSTAIQRRINKVSSTCWLPVHFSVEDTAMALSAALESHIPFPSHWLNLYSTRAVIVRFHKTRTPP